MDAKYPKKTKNGSNQLLLSIHHEKKSSFAPGFSFIFMTNIHQSFNVPHFVKNTQISFFFTSTIIYPSEFYKVYQCSTFLDPRTFGTLYNKIIKVKKKVPSTPSLIKFVWFKKYTNFVSNHSLPA